MTEPVLLEGLIERLRGRIDDDTWDFMDSYRRHGEWGLAIETLCDRLSEAGKSIPVDEVEEVREIGNSMGLRRRSFLMLTEQDK
jgi:hypothetical protein